MNSIQQMPNPYVIQPQKPTYNAVKIDIQNPSLGNQGMPAQGFAQAPNTNYNAVKIDIHNPSLGAQGILPQNVQAGDYNAVSIDIHNPSINSNQPEITPLYDYPQAPIYYYPQAQLQPVYSPELNQYVTNPVDMQAIQTVPNYPQFVHTIQQQNINVLPPMTDGVPGVEAIASQPVQEVTPVEAVSSVAPQVLPVEENSQTPEVPAPAVNAPNVEAPEIANEVKTPEVLQEETISPQVDLNSFLATLANSDFDIQANSMEGIASMVKTQPEKASDLIDTKVFDALANIINQNSKELTGPTSEQIEIRERIMLGQSINDEEKAIANTISPKEQAERNKIYALFTTAIMEKFYADEVNRLSGQTVPLTELPGISTIVNTLKDNENPLVRASAIDSLSYIQAPAYKNELKAIFEIAQKDPDVAVANAAKEAIANLK